MLKINSLTYSYKQADSEHNYNFSLDIKAAEIVGILGTSGSGKSTMLDLIAGFLVPTGGTVEFEEEDLLNSFAENRPVTILFQNHNLFEHLSVYKNILLGINRSLKSTPDDRDKVENILKEIALYKYKDKLVSALSGGQQQRVALARSLIRTTPILLLDEPFTGLDYDTRVEMLNLLRAITTQRNLYTIMVTHEIEDCKLIADKVYRLKKGRLEEESI